ncbi:MAG TPA: helix-turn-helix domain-containing protein [Acidimicrobiales bacterium]|jgi:hypothetical protein|nr:helix-turn-helix domain-containing protein [Acidimicrobiales bacterium]
MSDAPPRWNRLERDARRAQILAAARTLFSKRRYSAVSTQDIADEAGVARGLLSRAQVQTLLEGVMPLIARELLPAVLAARDRRRSSV